jgi:hypothetical protein
VRPPETRVLDPRVTAELDAIDAGLRRDAVDEQLAEVAAFAAALRDVRPSPCARFSERLDERAAAGFRDGTRGSLARIRRANDGGRGGATAARETRRATQTILGHRTVGVGLAAVLAAILAVPVALLATHRGAHSISSSSAAEVPTPKPAGVMAPYRNAAGGLPRGPVAAGAAGAAGASPNTQHASHEAAVSSSPMVAQQATPARQVEHGASLDIGVEPNAIQNAAQRVFSLASTYHGYVQESDVSAGSAAPSGATFQVHLPSSSLTAAIAAFAQIGRVRSESQTTNDVTEQHSSLLGAIGYTKAELSSLLKRLAQATGEPTIAVLKSEIRSAESHVAALERSLGSLDDRVEYTDVALSLTPESQSASATGDLTPSGALNDSQSILSTAVAAVVLVLAAVLPLAAVVGVALLAASLTRRRLRERALDGR